LKILFVHEVSYRKKVIFEIHEFPELLALRGHEVSFLEFDEGQKFWAGKQSQRGETIAGRVHEKSRIRLHQPFQLGIPGVDRLLAVLTVMPQLNRLFTKNAFDVVVLYAVPTYGFQTIWYAKKFRVPVVFRALDVSHKIRASILSPGIRWIEKYIYKNVDSLSANSAAMARYCTELGSRLKATKVHYPPLDLEHFQKVKRDGSLRQSLGFREDDRVLVYMGSFFYFSGLPDALREFARCSEGDPNLKFLLVGGGELDQELRNLVVELGLENKVVFTGFIAYQDLPKYLKIADVALNTLEPTLVADVAFPNKVLQYMAVGLPVVSTKLEGLFSVFESVGSILWELNSAAVMRTACALSLSQIREMSTNPETSSELARFSPLVSVDSFESELDRIARG
jgi:glycosyltransferase involved in cell wall biosynthesis